ncbi:outer membrane beta-barrel protein [Maribacter chungangensis]|uniref:Outer membrane beta-barrel protein n=1 Tax=Maribacter chungangensis TaxID=1069117 RepID=A0ABW3B029_9FLAO
MNVKLLLGLIFLVSVTTFAQEKKWSVEANYPISIGGDLGNDAPGIIDLGIKYRFVNLSFATIGFGVNSAVFAKNANVTETSEINETHWLVQPKLFSEFKLPGLSKLRPSLGVGVTFINSSFDGNLNGVVFDNSGNDTAFNVNVGLSYDITKTLFVQGQYDFIDYEATINQNDYLGLLKFGLGFRF